MIKTGNMNCTDRNSNKEMKNLKVLVFILEDKNHACPTIRIFSPLKKLEEQGRITLCVGTIVRGADVDVSLDKIADSDIVIIQRQAAKKELADHIFRLAGQLNKKVIVELDDLLFESPPSCHAQCLEEMRDEIIESLKKSDAVTCTSLLLSRELTHYAREVYILPNYIDTDIWSNGRIKKESEKHTTIVGFSGTPTHIDDLKMIAPAIKDILTRFGDSVEFRFWGCIVEELKGLDGVRFERELIPDYREYARTLRDSNIDIAIVPLVKNRFNECKSNIKFLEYSICRIPGIYSNITPYSESIIDGETGIVCDDDTDSWYRAMVKLIEERDLRNEIAENSYKEVHENYTLDANAYKWYDSYTALLDKTADNLLLAEARKGGFSLKVKGDDGSIKTLHSLYDPEAEAISIVNAFDFDGRGILVVLGLGLGFHVAEFSRKYPDAEILVIEFLPEICDLAKEHGPDLGQNVEIITNLTPDEAITTVAKGQTGNGIIPLSVFAHSSSVSAFPSYYSPLLDSLQTTSSVKLWDRLKYNRFRDVKLNILLIDSGYFLLKEAEKALLELGHNVHKIRIDRGIGGEALIGKFIETILEYKPDFLLTVNHLGFDEEGILAAFFNSIEMPVASWYVDSPNLIVKAFDNNVSPFMSLFLWDKSYMNDMKSMGFDTVEYLPLATDEKVFKILPGRKHRKKLDKYRCDISFVGNSMIEPVNKWMAKINDDIRPVADRLSEIYDRSSKMVDMMTDNEQEKVERLSEKERMDLEAGVIWKATLHYRLGCVKELREYGLRIYGDENWRNLLKSNVDICKPLNYYKELPLLYNACKINFNATSMQMKEAVNQRVFDVPACGAFILTDDQEALHDLFVVEDEVITFKEKEEIPEIVKFYLDNPEKREGIAIKGRKRVLKDHTYRHRLNSVIEVMKQRYR